MNAKIVELLELLKKNEITTEQFLIILNWIADNRDDIT